MKQTHTLYLSPYDSYLPEERLVIPTRPRLSWVRRVPTWTDGATAPGSRATGETERSSDTKRIAYTQSPDTSSWEKGELAIKTLSAPGAATHPLWEERKEEEEKENTRQMNGRR